MQEQNNELREISKAAPAVVWVGFKWAVLILIGMAILGFIAQGLGIISMDIERETVQHSRQYTETKVSLLTKLHSDWLALRTEIAKLKAAGGNEELIEGMKGQQRAIVNRMKLEARRIPASQIPQEIRDFLSRFQY